MSTPQFRRVLRRETHSPRTVATIIVIGLLLVALVYFVIEVVLWLAAQPALLVGPGAAVDWVVRLPDAEASGLVIAGGVVVGLIGLVLIILALAPGRLAKHQMQSDQRAVVVDNGVIASAVAQHLSDQTGVARSDITVGIGHRSADVTLRSVPGTDLDMAEVTALVNDELGSYALRPAVKPRVRIVTPSLSEDAR